MQARHGRLVAAVGVTTALVAGCSSSGARTDEAATAPRPSPTQEASPSPTARESGSTPDDPFAVPDPVTQEYVDRVVNTIYEEWGAITREILEQPADPTAITPVETRERIAALFGGQYLRQRLAEADETLRGDRDGLLPVEQFDQLRVSTRQVKAATGSCLVAAADLSFEGTARNGDVELAAFSLEPAAADASVTGWKIIDVVRARDEDGNRLPDSSILDISVESLSGVLGNTCEGATR